MSKSNKEKNRLSSVKNYIKNGGDITLDMIKYDFIFRSENHAMDIPYESRNYVHASKKHIYIKDHIRARKIEKRFSGRMRNSFFDLFKTYLLPNIKEKINELMISISKSIHIFEYDIKTKFYYSFKESTKQNSITLFFELFSKDGIKLGNIYSQDCMFLSETVDIDIKNSFINIFKNIEFLYLSTTWSIYNYEEPYKKNAIEYMFFEGEKISYTDVYSKVMKLFGSEDFSPVLYDLSLYSFCVRIFKKAEWYLFTEKLSNMRGSKTKSKLYGIDQIDEINFVKSLNDNKVLNFNIDESDIVEDNLDNIKDLIKLMHY